MGWIGLLIGAVLDGFRGLVIGATIGLVLGVVLRRILLPPPAASDAALLARVASLETRLAALETGSSSRIPASAATPDTESIAATG